MNTLVIFSGLPGTGKSTLANRLARELRWPLLCIDDVVGDVPENAGMDFWDSRIEILLGLAKAQLELGIDVIVDSVFMNTDRYHAQAIAREHQARFRPIYTFVSDETIWEERITARYIELNHPDVSTWDQVQRQRNHFRIWEPGTALFVDAIKPVEQNYTEVLGFVGGAEVTIKPMQEVPWVKGKYHG
ncbi:MAG: ATP-binding protein [Anaerolineae bacterium]|nr:ATP-binding protein [Anaerolineae bacterium]MCI0609284.1 ATP-binding protein [Anaerolineae bacterium]